MLQEKIRIQYDNMTKLEKKISEFILDQGFNINKMTSYEMAKELGIGQSSIIRFSQKLGYSSFRELLGDISIDIEINHRSEDIQVDEATKETNVKIKDQYYDILALTDQLNSSEVIDEAVQLMLNAGTILCIGSGHSNLFAEYFASQLLTSGVNTRSFTNLHLIFSQLLIMKESDLVVVFSESGESTEIVAAAREAKRLGIKIIAVTIASQNPLELLADVVLQTVDYKVRNFLRNSTMRCSQLYIIDMLILNYFKHHYDYSNEKSKESKYLIEKYLPRAKE